MPSPELEHMKKGALKRHPLNNYEFIQRASGEDIDTTEWRTEIVKKCIYINRNVMCGHSQFDALHIIDSVIRQRNVDGPIVECGVFKGGMSTKLSVVCKALGKELHLFDTFQGLPANKENIWPGFHQGNWCGTQDEVNLNLMTYGERDCCSLHVGRFCDTLDKVDIYPSVIFIDTDLVGSSRTCLKYFWPRLKGDTFFTHEAFFAGYMRGILKKEWWNESLLSDPPEQIIRPFETDALAYLIKEENIVS